MEGDFSTECMSVKDVISNSLDKKKTRLSLKFKEWKRSFYFIGEMISDNEYLSIFVDTTLSKKY
jgi:hypothetical protein